MPDSRNALMRLRLARLRWWALAIGAAVIGVALAVGVSRRTGAQQGGGLGVGAAFADSLLARTAAAVVPREVAFGDAVALGYLERLRLGLGSPFRLADYALRDPRLDSTARRRLAWALLDRTRNADTYQIDAAALTGVGSRNTSSSPPSGAERRAAERHLALIDAGVAATSDPRAGELALRIAYALAAAERSVDRGGIAAVAQVAALARDRRVAASDARRLLAAARAGGTDPLTLLAAWRRERRFAVERPSAAPVGEALELEAMSRIPVLLDSIRNIASTTADSSEIGDGGRQTMRSAPLLRAPAAARLASGITRQAPPQAAIVTAVRRYATALELDAQTGAEPAAWRAFAEQSVNEESFAAEYARLAVRDTESVATARVAVAAATALRPYAQEAPWFAGDPAPTDDELRREFGITSVRFDAGIPGRWRPYYRRSLADGLRDLRRVLPAMTLDGARVRFRSGTLGGATLAMHDPVTRTIHLPVATSAGALAHEVAHDLDWQMGRRRYARRGSYGTDIVVREQRGRLAASLRGLTSARLIPPAGANTTRPPDDVRPAEVFARTLDWFVSMALARDGRVNGYLSAVQDEALTGHVAVLPREIGGWSAQALADVLQEMTLVGAPLREWLLAQWGPARVRRPYALAREVLAVPITRRVDVTARGSAWASALLCGASSRTGASRARVKLARLAAEARARGIVRMRAQRYPDAALPAWAESALGYGPWSPELAETVVHGLASVILTRMESSGAMGAALDWGDAARGEDRERIALTAGSDCRS